MPEARQKVSNTIEFEQSAGNCNFDRRTSSISDDCSSFFKDNVWGFRITGGAEFGMPITIFQVTEGGRANQAGIVLGDTIVKINGVDTNNMSLADAQQRIQEAGNDLNLSVKSFEEDDKNMDQHDVQLQNGLEKQKEIDRKFWIPQPERKVWHPIVWQQPPPPIPPEQHGKDAPHHRIIRNIHRFFKETDDKGARQKTIEHMLLALPTASKQY